MNRRQAIKGIAVAAGVLATVGIAAAEEDLLRYVDGFQFVYKLFPEMPCHGSYATIGWKGLIHAGQCGGPKEHAFEYRDAKYQPTGKHGSYKCRDCHCKCQFGDYIRVECATKEVAIAEYGELLKEQARECVKFALFGAPRQVIRSLE